MLEKKKSNAPDDTPLLILVYKTLGHPLVCREGRRSERPAGRTRPRWGRYHTGSGATPPLGSSGEGRGSSSSSEPACSWLSGSPPLPCGLCPVGEKNELHELVTIYHVYLQYIILWNQQSSWGSMFVNSVTPHYQQIYISKNLLQRCVFDILKYM